MTISAKQEKAVNTPETAMTQLLFLCKPKANNNILRHCMTISTRLMTRRVLNSSMNVFVPEGIKSIVRL